MTQPSNAKDRSTDSMGDRKNSAAALPTEKLVDDLHKLIEGIEIAMLTTRQTDGQLVSRAMATQQHQKGADIWFMTSTETHKLDDLRADPNVNVSYYKDGEWVSVSGRATIVTDRAKIKELYKPDWRAWLHDEGGAKNGGPEDPRIALIEVEATSASYMKRTVPKPVMLFNIVKGMITGEEPKVGREGHLDAAQLKH